MNSNNKIQEFQLFCLENYRILYNLPGEVTLDKFHKYKVFDFLEYGYEVLHTQAMNYIISEINEYIKSQE
jgi:hypothetical protein